MDRMPLHYVTASFKVFIGRVLGQQRHCGMECLLCIYEWWHRIPLHFPWRFGEPSCLFLPGGILEISD